MYANSCGQQLHGQNCALYKTMAIAIAVLMYRLIPAVIHDWELWSALDADGFQFMAGNSGCIQTSFRQLIIQMVCSHSAWCCCIQRWNLATPERQKKKDLNTVCHLLPNDQDYRSAPVLAVLISYICEWRNLLQTQSQRRRIITTKFYSHSPQICSPGSILIGKLVRVLN